MVAQANLRERGTALAWIRRCHTKPPRLVDSILSLYQRPSFTIGDNVSLLIAALGVRFLYLAAVNLQSNGLERRG